MIQTIDKIDGYRYITTTFQFSKDKALLESILNEATRLSKIVPPHGPGGYLRPFSVRLDKNIGGKLAEEAFKIYVEDLIKTKRSNANLVTVAVTEESLEEIGTQIDFVLDTNGKKKTIEVRSSFSYKTNLRRLFGVDLIDSKGAFSIIGWYKHQHKPEEKKKDHYVFAIHFYHPTEIQNKCKSEVTVYIAGAASKETLETKGYDDDLKQKGALYHIINPLISVPDPVDVINEMLEI